MSSICYKKCSATLRNTGNVATLRHRFRSATRKQVIIKSSNGIRIWKLRFFSVTSSSQI